MRHSLSPHPDSPCGALDAIDAVVGRSESGRLRLCFVARGRIADIVLPPAGAPGRADRLWHHSCFELFLRAEGTESYDEFNLSPSRQWAAYRFDGYRAGMRDLPIAAPAISTRGLDGCFALRTHFIPPLPAANWRINLAAVIEEKSGRLSYWALRHRPGKPDFHHPDCFAVAVAAGNDP